jgi:hypothetical protein
VVASVVSHPAFVLRQNGHVKEESRRMLIRHSDEPKLELGAVVEIEDGVVGVVLARFKPSGQRRDEDHYIVQLKTGERIRHQMLVPESTAAAANGALSMAYDARS